MTRLGKRLALYGAIATLALMPPVPAASEEEPCAEVSCEEGGGTGSWTGCGTSGNCCTWDLYYDCITCGIDIWGNNRHLGDYVRNHTCRNANGVVYYEYETRTPMPCGSCPG